MNSPSPFRLGDLWAATRATATMVRRVASMSAQLGLRGAINVAQQRGLVSEGEAQAMTLTQALVAVLRLQGEDVTPAAVSTALPMSGQDLDPRAAPMALARFRCAARWERRRVVDLKDSDFPCVLRLKDGQCLVAISRVGADGLRCAGRPDAEGRVGVESLATLALASDGDVLLVGAMDPVNGSPASDDAESMRAAPRRWILQRFFDDRRLIVLMCVSAVLLNLFALAMPLYQRAIYDRVIPNLAMDSLWALSIGMLIGLVFEFMLKNVRGDFVEAAALRVSHLVQHKVIAALLAARGGAKGVQSGTLHVALRDIDGLANLVPVALVTILVDLPFFFIFIGALWFVGGGVAVATTLGAIAILAIGMISATGLGALSERGARLSQARSQQVVDAADGVATIKANQFEGRFLRDWSVVTDHLSMNGHSQREWMEWSNGLTAFCVQVVTVLVLVVGVHQMQTGDTTVGALIACSMLAGRAMGPIAQATLILSKANQAMAQLGALSNLIAMPPEKDTTAESVVGSGIRGEVAFKNVSFAYEDGAPPALRDVTLTIKAGERIAVIGKSGSGKTTLLQLAGAMAEPTAGKILFDGFTTEQYGISRVRSAISIATQDSIVFDTSLKENILMGARGVTEEELMQALRISGVDQILASLPEGFGSKLGHRGARLSTGQRQCVLVARALVRRSSILILDEPTASLDSASEQRMRDGLMSLPRDRTMIISTHRMELMPLVDRVIWIDEGRIVADRPRDELLAQLRNAGVVRSAGSALAATAARP